MGIAEFYNEAQHLGNRFGVRGVFYGPDGHLGVDFNRHARGTRIPSWTAGTVAVNTWYATLGWTLIVRRSDGLFAGWAHLNARSPLPVGMKIAVGQSVGPLGNSGLFTTAAHVHCTLEPSIRIGTPSAIDPLPYIRAAVQAERPIQPLPKQEETMAKNFVNTGTYVNGAAGKGTKCLTLWEGGRIELYERDPANKQEMAVSMSAAYGPHVPVSNDVFNTLATP